MSNTYRRRPHRGDWQERGNKRFFEIVTVRAEKWHTPKCICCGNHPVQKRAAKRGKRQRAMIQEIKDSE